LVKGNWSKEEDELILKLQKAAGNKWSEIASHLPARTEHSVKNRWFTLVRASSKDDSTHQSSDEASAEIGSEDSSKAVEKTLIWWPPYFPNYIDRNSTLPFPFYVSQEDVPFVE
jgi:hypothetical protein